MPPYKISVEGNAAAGKSTFLQFFKEANEEVEVLPEPIYQWRNVAGHDLMSLYCESPGRWGAYFQLNNMLAQMELFSQYSDDAVVIHERSAFSAYYCFTKVLQDDNCIDSIGCDLLRRAYELTTKIPYGKIDLFVYIRSDPDECLERYKIREPGSTRLTKELMRKYHDVHEKVFMEQNDNIDCPVYVIDVVNDLSYMKKVYLQKFPEILGNSNLKTIVLPQVSSCQLGPVKKRVLRSDQYGLLVYSIGRVRLDNHEQEKFERNMIPDKTQIQQDLSSFDSHSQRHKRLKEYLVVSSSVI